MKKASIIALLLTTVTYDFCLARGSGFRFNFDLLFPPKKQRLMGLHKLTPREREALRAHVESLILYVLKMKKPLMPLKMRKFVGSKTYYGLGGGHWISKNLSGEFIILEDGSLWKIDPLDRIYTMLWLPVSSIVVIRSSGYLPGYDYLLINTDDGEKAHARYLGRQ